MVLLFSAWQHFELLRHGYQVEEIQRERAVEEEASRRLRLEIETLKSPARIEALATQKLHLVAPGRDEAIVIERVLPAEPPAKSVIADARPTVNLDEAEAAVRVSPRSLRALR